MKPSNLALGANLALIGPASLSAAQSPPAVEINVDVDKDNGCDCDDGRQSMGGEIVAGVVVGPVSAAAGSTRYHGDRVVHVEPLT